MTKEQAFALHIRTLLMDLVNNHVGSLRFVAECIDPDYTVEPHGPLQDLLKDWEAILIKKGLESLAWLMNCAFKNLKFFFKR